MKEGVIKMSRKLLADAETELAKSEAENEMWKEQLEKKGENVRKLERELGEAQEEVRKARKEAHR